MIPSEGCDRPDTEEQLRARVEDATTELKRATSERDRLFEVSRDVSELADGAFAVKQAARLQHDALRKLRQALRDFEEFQARNR